MKSPKAQRIGLRGGLGIAGIGLLVLAPLAYVAPALGALGLAAIAVGASILLHRKAGRLAASHEKLSGEIDVLSAHLLKVEALATAAAARARALPVAAPVAAPPASRDAALAAGIEEVTAEIGLLSGIVRELAAVVSTQDGEIATLRTDLHAVASRAETPPAAVPPAQVARERPTPPARPAIVPAPASATFRPPAFEAPSRDPARDAALVEAFDGDGLEVWLQPVVTLPQRKVVSYEALARLRLGPKGGEAERAEILAPDAFLPALERHGRTTALDRRMLRSVATIARHLQGRGSNAAVAYGLSPLSLFEPGFLRSLGGLVGDGPDLSGRLVVALPQASWRSLDPEQKTVLAELRGRIGFVLDRPTDLRFDAAALAERGIGQVKVPAALLLRPPARATLSDIALEDLVASLGRAGLRLVACDVEREADVPDLIDRSSRARARCAPRCFPPPRRRRRPPSRRPSRSRPRSGARSAIFCGGRCDAFSAKVFHRIR